ncbi:hypothetical protein SRHO_G00248490 [Serrasalmus rhombeus]
MERLRTALIMCVLFSRISGAEVEMRVRPGDDVTLYSDCVWETGFNTVWFRNCSHEHQPRLLISTKLFMRGAFPRYFVVLNSSNQAHDLLVKNVTESDVGLYYCAIHKRKITEDNTGVLRNEDVYRYGNRTTRLSLLIPFAQTTPPVSDCSVCWNLLVSLCPVCALLSSLLSSTCVYCICINKTKDRNVPLTWTNQISAQTSASKTLTIIRPPAPVSEMERSRAVLMTLVCILFSRISGAEVEMRVRPGDDVTLYSDCVWKIGFNIVWFRNSSYVGLYYCAVYEKNFKDEKGVLHSEYIYHYGKRTTRLSLLVPCADLPQTPSTPPVSDCSVCWKLLVSVCPVCVLLSATCVCCIYRHTKKGPEDGRELLAGTVFQEKKVTKDEAGVIRNQLVYHYGNRTTRLSLLVPCTADIPQTTSTPPASDCSVWKLLVTVCPVFALLSSTCVYCICRNRFRVIAEEEAGQEWRKNRKTDEVGCVEEHHCERSMNGESCLHTEVCYTSLKSGLKSD